MELELKSMELGMEPELMLKSISRVELGWN